MASLHKGVMGEAGLWQTLSPSALTALKGSLRPACLLGTIGSLEPRGRQPCPSHRG